MNKILKSEIKEKILAIPEYSYGVNKVKCILKNGKEFSDVFVGWGEEIIKVGNSDKVPFNANDVVEVINDIHIKD